MLPMFLYAMHQYLQLSVRVGCRSLSLRALILISCRAPLMHYRFAVRVGRQILPTFAYPPMARIVLSRVKQLGALWSFALTPLVDLGIRDTWLELLAPRLGKVISLVPHARLLMWRSFMHLLGGLCMASSLQAGMYAALSSVLTLSMHMACLRPRIRPTPTVP